MSLPPCVRTVRRGSTAVVAEPSPCVEAPGFTQLVELPAVESCGSGQGWRCEKLSTGEVYVAYDHVFAEMDSAFSAYGRPRAILLYGPPGTGKSYAPRFFARKWGRELIVASVSDILSKYLGESEERLAKFLDEAERRDAVLLLDEADPLMRSRLADSEHKFFTVHVLLTRIQEMKAGIVVATTNAQPRLLDRALLRGGRFKPVAVPLPARDMLHAFATAVGIRDVPPHAMSFPDVLDPRPVRRREEWYDVLTPPASVKPQDVKYVVKAERGVVKFADFPFETSLSVVYFYFTLVKQRQVWWLWSRKADFEAVFDMADEFGAVVAVDPRVAADAAVYARPMEKGLLVFLAPGLDFPDLALDTTAVDNITRHVAELWQKERPSCRLGKPDQVVKHVFWGLC